MLPSIAQSEIGVCPIDWSGLPKRFLNEGELEVLVALLRSVNPRVVIEFGCNVGRTAKALLREIPMIERYIGIDVARGYVPSKAVQHNEVPERPGHLVAGDPLFHLMVSGRGSLDLTPRDLPECDAVFIDGDHGREAVLHDSALARALLHPGGIIVWHDYHDLGTVDVREVLDRELASGRNIAHVAGTWLAFERAA